MDGKITTGTAIVATAAGVFIGAVIYRIFDKLILSKMMAAFELSTYERYEHADDEDDEE
jgi:hypothetical protein